MANSISMEGSDTRKTEDWKSDLTWRVCTKIVRCFSNLEVLSLPVAPTHSIDTLLETYSFHFKLFGFGKWLCCGHGRNLAGATLVLRRRLAIFLLVLLIWLFGMWGKSLAKNIKMTYALLDFEWYQDAWGCSIAFFNGQHYNMTVVFLCAYSYFATDSHWL